MSIKVNLLQKDILILISDVDFIFFKEYWSYTKGSNLLNWRKIKYKYLLNVGFRREKIYHLCFAYETTYLTEQGIIS